MNDAETLRTMIDALMSFTDRKGFPMTGAMAQALYRVLEREKGYTLTERKAAARLLERYEGLAAKIAFQGKTRDDK